MRMRVVLTLSCALGVFLGAVAPSFGLTSSNLLVIYNDSSAEGYQIASYYAQVYPGVQTLGLANVPVAEEVSGEVYLSQIRAQVLPALTDSIDCIVTTKGLPLRINNPYPGIPPIWWQPYSSLESELARIDSIDSTEGMGNQSILNSLALNPYYRRDQPFSYTTYGTRLAARLDAFTVQDVCDSILRSRGAVLGRPGMCGFVLDDDPDGYDRMAELRDNVLAPSGQQYLYDGSSALVRDAPGSVIGYVSHGVHGGASESYVRDADYGLAFEFAPGAVFHTWESFNAYTFEGDLDTPSPKNQGLLAQWIARGGTVGTGHVEEPKADPHGVANEDIFFDRLLKGYTWAEAAWSSIAQLSFVNTVVGDPLMLFRKWAPGDCDQNGYVDGADYTAIADNYGASDVGWEQGDFTGDFTVDGLDYCLWADNYGTGDPDGTALPEPAMLLLLAVGALGLMRRRRA